MHLLALVASRAVRTEAELHDFFAATFYGRTLPLPELHRKLDRVRTFLAQHDLLEKGTQLRATRFGELTSELYLDPLSAIVLREALSRAPIGVGTFPLLAAVAATPDLPSMFLRRGEEADLLSRYHDEADELLVRPEEPPLELDLEGFLSTLKTATVLEAWLAETPMVEITEKYGIGAGDIRAKVEDAEWLLYGAGRLAVAFQRRLGRPLDDLALRVRYGVLDELLDLVRLRGIGRVRARLLFRAGLRDRDTLREAPFARIETALRSRALAEMVVAQLDGTRRASSSPPATPAPAPAPAPRRGARRLDDFGEAPEP